MFGSTSLSLAKAKLLQLEKERWHTRLTSGELGMFAGILRMRQAQYACLAKCMAMTLGSKEHWAIESIA
jgi:hypothetical protein